jgi:hypothetical protein
MTFSWTASKRIFNIHGYLIFCILLETNASGEIYFHIRTKQQWLRTFAEWWPFTQVVGVERGPLSLVSTTEELLERKSMGSCLENREYGHADHMTPSIRKSSH